MPCPLVHGISFIHSFAGNKHMWDRALRWSGGYVSYVRALIDYLSILLYVLFISLFIYLSIYLFIYCSYIFKT